MTVESQKGIYVALSYKVSYNFRIYLSLPVPGLPWPRRGTSPPGPQRYVLAAAAAH